MAEDFYGFPGGGWGAGGTALGLGADIYAFIQNQKARAAQQRIYDILANPAKLSQYVSRWYNPMSATENQAVLRDLGANWSVMTGGAPGGGRNKYVADALAKIESSRYQTAASQAIQALGGAASSVPGQAPMGATGNIMRSLWILKQLRDRGEGKPTGLADIPGMQDYRAGEGEPDGTV